MNAKTNMTTILSGIASNVVAWAEARIKSDSFGATVASLMAQAYAAIPTKDEAQFADVFGTGGHQSEDGYKPGSLAETVRSAVAKCKEDKQKMALAIIKQRLSEARKLRKAGLTLADNESIQAALKRIPKKAPGPQLNVGEGRTKVAIAADASVDDVADALSKWLNQHEKNRPAFEKALADFMVNPPVPAKTRTKKQA